MFPLLSAAQAGAPILGPRSWHMPCAVQFDRTRVDGILAEADLFLDMPLPRTIGPGRRVAGGKLPLRFEPVLESVTLATAALLPERVGTFGDGRRRRRRWRPAGGPGRRSILGRNAAKNVNAARGGVIGLHPGDSSVGRMTKPSGELPIRRSDP